MKNEMKWKTKNITLSEQFQNITLSEQFQNITLSEQFKNITPSEQFKNSTKKSCKFKAKSIPQIHKYIIVHFLCLVQALQ